MLSRLVLAAALVISLSASLPAQYNNPRRPQPGRQPIVIQAIEVQGMIEGVMRGAIVVLDNNGQRCQIVVPPAARIHVTGSANADYLQSGQIVEFRGEINDRGAIREKVDSLTLVTPSPERQMGMFPAEAASEQSGFAAGAEGGSKGGKAKHTAGKAGATLAGTYRIVGRLIVGRGGKLSVQTGRSALTLELTEQPTIAVDFNDYTVAAKGDKVTVKAIKMPTRLGAALAAADVKIELAEPLAGAKKKGPSAAKRPTKASKKAEGLPEPAADK